MLLYLHIPFCDSKCNYCAFNSYTHLHELKIEYMSAICKQLKDNIENFNIKKRSLKTLYIGGGTPSTINASLYEPFFNIAYTYLQKEAEITSEANPNSATKKWLKSMKSLGVNRISFGAQSFNEKKLKFLNRSHNAQDIKKAVNNAYDIGVKDLSIDLMYATNMDTKKLLQSDLNEAFALPINHISAYALIIEEGTPFFKVPKVAYESLNDTKWLIKSIEKNGFKQYEISNFGNHKSKHNLGYWRYDNYLGIGSGAVASINKQRFYPHKSVNEYIKDPLFKLSEKLDEKSIKLEKILLAMRSCVGFNPDILTDKEKQKVKILLDEKKLYIKNKKIYNKNYLLADELALFIL